VAPRLPLLVGLIALGTLVAGGCARTSGAGGGPPSVKAAADPSTFWNSATVYFLLIDRFHNGDTSNDHAHGRAQNSAVLRSFEGGDLAGVLQKIEEG
jgi:alpha-amylase